MDITFKIGDLSFSGKATTIEKDREFQYLLDLGSNLQFTLHLNDEGYWESDNLDIDPEIVMYAGDAIENLEDFEDIFMQLDCLGGN